MRHIFLLTAPLLMSVTGTAPAADAALSRLTECFWGSQVTGFSDAGPDRAILNIGRKASWELTLAAGCPDVDWALNIGIQARGGDRICRGRPAELLIPDVSGRDYRRCLVRSIRKLSRGEAAAARGETPRP